MKIKRFLGVLLTMLLALGVLALPAGAAVKDTTKDVTLTIYALEASDGSEVTVDASVTGEEITITDRKPVEGASFLLYRVADDETSTVVPDGVTPIETDRTDAQGRVSVVIPAEQQGRYLVVEAAMPVNAKGTTVPFLVDLPMTNPEGTDYMYEVFAYPKQVIEEEEIIDSDTDFPDPQVTKEVSGDNGETYGDTANIDSYHGQKAYWRITAEVPSCIADMTIFNVKDVLDYRLIPPQVSEVEVKSDGKDIPKSAYTVEISGQTILVKFDPKALTSYTAVQVIFPTAIDISVPEALNTRIENLASLTFTVVAPESVSDEDTDGIIDHTDVETTDTDATTTETETIITTIVEVWTGSIEGFKHDKDNKALSGAEFTLYSDKDCKNVVAKTTSDKEGHFYFTGLKDGTYYLKETKAPDGYQQNNNVLEVKIDGKKQSVVKIDVLNVPKTDLPLTGGAGVIGITLIGAAVVLTGILFIVIAFKKYRKAGYSAA